MPMSLGSRPWSNRSQSFHGERDTYIVVTEATCPSLSNVGAKPLERFLDGTTSCSAIAYVSHNIPGRRSSHRRLMESSLKVQHMDNRDNDAIKQ